MPLNNTRFGLPVTASQSRAQLRARRRYLKAAMASCASACMGPSKLFAATDAPTLRHTGRRLILLELAGANDGLNTLVPVRNDHYYKLRPDIALSGKQTMALSDEQGLHEALRTLMPFWERGEMSIVQGLGYPSANRSHFKSIALWESAGDGESAALRDGWITHSIEHALARKVVDPHGISLAGGMGIFASDSGRWLSMERNSQIIEAAANEASADEFVNPALAIVNRRLQSLDETLSQLSRKLVRSKATPTMAGGKLGKQLQQLVQLVSAGVDTPVFRVRLDGFDTHANQLNRHARLLRQFGTAMADLRAQLVAMGEWNNTLIMTYSEFGRRAAQNQSGGTDHGTAAPHFLLGGAVSGGLYGQQPDLGKLVAGDPEFTTDYRSLYRSVLSDWFEMQVDTLRDYQSDSLASLFT